MIRSWLPLSWVPILVITLGLHGVFHPYAYIQFWWLDIVMHYVGGIGVGFLGLWLAVRVGLLPLPGTDGPLAERMRRAFPEIPWWWPFAIAVGAIAYIGPWWEQAEAFLLAYLDMPFPPGYIADTTLDYVMDTLGTITAWMVQWKVWQEARATSPSSPQR
jgi:hypothetical protein